MKNYVKELEKELEKFKPDSSLQGFLSFRKGIKDWFLEFIEESPNTLKITINSSWNTDCRNVLLYYTTVDDEGSLKYEDILNITDELKYISRFPKLYYNEVVYDGEGNYITNYYKDLIWKKWLKF